MAKSSLNCLVIFVRISNHYNHPCFLKNQPKSSSLSELEIRIRNWPAINKKVRLSMASLLEMYSRFVLEIILCLARIVNWSENGQWSPVILMDKANFKNQVHTRRQVSVHYVLLFITNKGMTFNGM